MKNRIGHHVLVDFYASKHLSDEETVKRALVSAAQRAGATVLMAHVHPFPDKSGVTGVALLAESHISIHTWPEHDLAAIDVFMCGDMNIMAALEELKSALKPARVTTKWIQRGEISETNGPSRPDNIRAVRETESN